MNEFGVTRREALAGAAAMAAMAGGPAAEAAVKPPGDLLALHDALGLADLVRRKEVSAAELLDLAIARSEALNPRLNFLTQKHYERARAALAAGLPAAAPEAPFRGVPWLLKDLNTYIEGEITSQGSRFYAGYRATQTSELVRRHEKAGLVIFGKTAAPEFGLTATTESKAHGLTRNPWNPEHSAGGSSGGAAVAVASGIVPAAHATDGGGSIRIPASCCGLFGLKPSRGRVPMGPPRTEGWGGMSVHHAVTRSVRDSAALLDATWGAEPGSRYVAPTPERPFLQEVGRPPGRLRIALNLKPAAGTPVDPEVRTAVQAAARLCESLGHHVEEAAPVLDLDAIARATIAIISTAVAVDLQDREAATGIKPSLETLETVTLAYYQLGLTIPGVAVTRGNNDLMATAITVARFMETYDLLLSPVVASPPPKLGVLGLSPPKLEDFYAAVAPYTPFASLANQTGMPAMSVPLGMSRGGLPIGAMFAARYGDEATLFRLASQLEQAAPWNGRQPKV